MWCCNIQNGESIMVEVAAGPSERSEKVHHVIILMYMLTIVSNLNIYFICSVKGVFPRDNKDGAGCSPFL